MKHNDMHRSAILERLRCVLDPELDESIVELGFVESLDLHDDEVEIRLRLPTAWCSPAFAWMMCEDSRREVLAVDGVRRVTVRLPDHVAGDQIEAAVNAGLSFDDAFPGESSGGLDGLRHEFLQRGFWKRQEQLVRRLLDAGRSSDQVAAMRIGDVDLRDADVRAYVERRAELGLSHSPDRPLVTDLDDRPVSPERFSEHLRRARTVRVALDAQAAFCCAVLEARQANSCRSPFVQLEG